MLVAIGLVAALVGCQPVDLRALDGTQWRLVAIAGIDALPGRPALPPMITFSRDTAAGFGYCSTYSIDGVAVDATVTPAHLSFGALSLQSSECAEALQRVDRAFVQALEQAQTIRLDGPRLEIDGVGGSLRFERVAGTSSDTE